MSPAEAGSLLGQAGSATASGCTVLGLVVLAFSTLAERWSDPTFPIHFPFFGSAAYWSQQAAQLRPVRQDP